MRDVLLAGLAAIASFFLVSLIFAALIVFCRNHKNNRRNPNFLTWDVRDLNLSSIVTTECWSFDPNQCPISMQELVQATQNFSSDLIVGDGSFGLVYKARLSNGLTVAVKKLGSESFQGFREFAAETETLGKLRHPNIVTILGCCATGPDRLLIYEFVEQGSLDQWLLDTSSSSPSQKLPLNWATRLKIVRGVAKGLAYMHNLETPIIHRDIKASNVLLNSDFEARIADFGLARAIEGSHAHVSTQVAGTMGYMAPEYINGANMATKMGDVYSFGVLMMEIATGIRPNLPFKSEEGGKEVRLVDWAVKMLEQGRHMEMLDATISREGLRENEVVQFFRIAKECTSETPAGRPPMKEVVASLNQIIS